MTVGIQSEFRNYLCFRWFSDDNLNISQTFRMTRNCFGVKDAQFNTIAVIREQAKMFQKSKKIGSEALMKSCYSDDLVCGANSVEEVLVVKKEVSEILADGGMQMHKWRMSGVPDESDTQGQPIANPLNSDRVLGVGWDNGKDLLLFNPNSLLDFVSQAKPCKRSILGTASRLYDPIGLLSPFIMVVKLLLQKSVSGESPEKHGIFIKNRLVNILELSRATEWFHCPGKINPADLPSRGMLMEKLKNNELWLKDPPFLLGNDYPNVENPLDAGHLNMMTCSASVKPKEEIVDVSRFSKLSRAIRTYALVIRAVALFKASVPVSRRRNRNDANSSSLCFVSSNLRKAPLTPTELKVAKQRLVRESQRRCFREAMESGEPAEDSKIAQFAPFISIYPPSVLEAGYKTLTRLTTCDTRFYSAPIDLRI